MSEVRRTGVNERNLDRIPTDNNENTNTGKSQNNQPTNNGSLSEYEKQFDVNRDGVLDENELISKNFMETHNFDIGREGGLRDWQ